MLTVVCGPFHPHLERAIADDLIAAKSADPLAPVLVVVPSDSLRRRVVDVLAQGRGVALLNLSVLTFHQLSRRVVEETAGLRFPSLVTDKRFEELMRLIIERSGPDAPFGGVAATHGGCTALWQSLRDLKDAKVPPAALVDAVGEGVFPTADASRLQALGTLYRDVLGAAQSAGWTDYTDVDAAAADCASASAYLQAQRSIAYYGFYDLTQAQFDVLRAVAARADTTVYFPAVPLDPWWAFADRFLNRYLVGLSARPVQVLADPMPRRKVTRVTCSGASDEVVACAKEILRLVEEEGFAFEQIGVVARTLEPYTDLIAREFRRHAIPWVTTARRALIRSPLAQSVWRLLRIAEGEPSREDMIDLLSSPGFRVHALVSGAEARPALWDVLARSIGVSTGDEAWERLAALSGPEANDAGSGTYGAEAAMLLQVVRALRDACNLLPDVASGTAHAHAWGALLERLLGLSPVDEDEGDESPDAAVSRELLKAVAEPAHLDGFRPHVARGTYLEAVRRSIEAGSVPITDRVGRGVLVADAAAARGVGFRALLVLGLNDGVFPRVIREDAFLRDAERRLIETTLGYKIPEKLAGHEEERLLFSALVQAADDHLVLLTQRADDAGRALAPSWFIAAGHARLETAQTVDVPRRAREKPGVPPFDRLDRYTLREAAVLAALHGETSGRVAEDRTAASLARAQRLRGAVDAWGAKLSVYDGEVGAPTEWLADTHALGYTATGLKAYAECPWRFYLTQVLGLEPLPDAEARHGPTPRDWGLLAHEALARAIRAGAPPIETVWRDVCAQYARRHPIGYALVWDLEVERIGRVLAQIAAEDRAELARSGHSPLESEVTLRGVLAGVRDIPIRGRLDRVDASPDGGLRVIDWKFSWRASHDRAADPVVAAVRGQALQPPLYAELAQAYGTARRVGSSVPIAVAVAVSTVGLRAREEPLQRTRYEPDKETAEQVRTTLARLVEGIESGLFPMIPDMYCGWCEVEGACRRRHAPSRARTERDPRVAQLAGIRRTPVPTSRDPVR